MQLGEILQKTTEFFKEKKIETARLDSELLIAAVLGLDRIQLYIKFEYSLTHDEISKCRDSVRRRSQGEPIAYILEKRDFYNSTFFVKSGVLIPRPETEGLVEEALRWVKKSPQKKYEFADFGFGSGCIGLSLLKEMKEQAHLTGLDISNMAIEVAQENSRRLEIQTAEYFCCRVQDFDFAGKCFDIVLANPPYISRDDQNVQAHVKAFEPAEALFADENGLKEIKDWAQIASQVLRSRGLAAFEIGSTQGETVKNIFAQTEEFASIKVAKDLAGLDRYIFAEKS
jgi:release factor glutamine methyltransferase